MALLSFLSVVCFQFVSAQSLESIDWPTHLIEGIESEAVLNFEGPDATIDVSVNGSIQTVDIVNGKAVVALDFGSEVEEVVINANGIIQSNDYWIIPLWSSVLPPLLAIVLALITKEVIISLFLGIFLGSSIIGYAKEGVIGIFGGFFAIIDTYLLNALNDAGHISVILFSVLIGGVVAIISKNGGMQGVVNRVAKYANNPTSGQMATWVLGIIIFFDDYANSLVVGNTMRPVTDKLKISREKLAYIVDSTAAPIVSIAFVTTWIGAELGYIEQGIEHIGTFSESAYTVFLHSLKYAYYPVFALIFIVMVIYQKREFGPMYTAESNARKGDLGEHSVTHEEMAEFEPKKGISIKSYNAIIPILILIFGTIFGLMYTGITAAGELDPNMGFFRKLSAIIGSADSYVALLWASMLALIGSVLISAGSKTLKVKEGIEVGIVGFKSMVPAIVILILAWSLAAITSDMHTAEFLKSLWPQGLAPELIPMITFTLAVVVSFSTGSSWGTMAILYPIILPTAYELATHSGLEHGEILPLFYNTVSCVLAGAVLGDHCSPISDTTILSSLASSCNHIQHVRTQLPYALTVGTIAVGVGTVPTAFGMPVWMAFVIGIVVMWFALRFFGKKVEG